MNLISCSRNRTLKLYYRNQKCTKSRTLFHFHIIESFGSYIKTFRLYYQNFNVPKVETYFIIRIGIKMFYFSNIYRKVLISELIKFTV